jgi:outer membrane cobalamin receptor
VHQKFAFRNKTLKYILLYIAFLIALPLSGQMSFDNDTIKIQEVVISRKKSDSENTGYKKTTIDTTVLNDNSHASVAELLSANSNIFIKSYGMGGVASPSFRGTGASHTQLAWNGININHPMLGQSDLALIPSGMVDDIQLYYGGASMPLNSGGIGGIINLETKPVWKKETCISVNPGIGSYGQYTGLVKIQSGTANFQTVTKVFFQKAENDFRYYNKPDWQISSHNQLSHKGFIQELYSRHEKGVASVRLWYESTDRNLPSAMTMILSDQKATQYDESLRTMIDYNHFSGLNTYSITGAWMTTWMHYTNSKPTIDSRNFSETLVLKTGVESHALEFTKLKVYVNEELNFIKSNNYDGNLKRNTLSLTASAERNATDRFGTNFLVRETVDSDHFLIPDFSAGMQFRIIDGLDYFIKANLSRNSKIPTLNDLFWVSAGNPDLKNEYAFMYEVTYEMKQKISAPLTFKYDLSVYKNNIKDMIQWLPGESSNWTPGNLKRVKTSGIESSVSFNYMLNKMSACLNAGYSFTKATTEESVLSNDLSLGKQLIYVPVNQANSSLRMSYKPFYASWLVIFTGKRFTRSDNIDYLPPNILNSLITGFKINFKANSMDLNFHIDNLFNINYQTVANYPLPGRLYSLKLLILLHK